MRLLALFVETKENFDVKNLTSFKIGGNIAKVYFPKSDGEFEEVISGEENAEVFGNFSNTLVSSDGYDGTVIVTSKMNDVRIDGCNVYAGSGVKGPKLAQMVQKQGLSGFEFMIGFPGSLGGNVFMNASANGQCISDRLVRVKCYARGKGIFWLSKDEMKFGYRSSICQREPIAVLGAEFELAVKPTDEILQTMDENLAFRKAHQPSLALPNCGSVFRNPEGNSAGRLLDSVGAKTFSVGGVRVWENHANFIINAGNASSMDVLELMHKMFSAVKNQFDITLKPEVRYLGNKNIREVELCKILNIK